MSEPTVFIGIDVAKDWLDVAERPSGRTRRVANDEAGWADLAAELAARAGAVLVVLEASGGYEAGAALALAAAGLTPAVVNPVCARRFAQSLGRRGKTDRLDAALLAELGERLRPTPKPLPADSARTLTALLARRAQLTKLLTQERNRCRRAAPAVADQCAELIALLARQRAAIEARLAAAVDADPAWAALVALLDTIPGFGALSATVLAVGLPELGHCSAKEANSLLGTAPHPHESGTGRGERHIAGGRGKVRHVLYEAVMTTVRIEPTIKAQYDRLKARGKTHKEALIACLRRLIGIATAMVRDGLTWQETKVGQGLFAPPRT